MLCRHCAWTILGSHNNGVQAYMEVWDFADECFVSHFQCMFVFNVVRVHSRWLLIIHTLCNDTCYNGADTV